MYVNLVFMCELFFVRLNVNNVVCLFPALNVYLFVLVFVYLEGNFEGMNTFKCFFLILSGIPLILLCVLRSGGTNLFYSSFKLIAYDTNNQNDSLAMVKAEIAFVFVSTIL